MSWLALLLVGLACTDLVHSVRPSRWLRYGPGAAVARGDRDCRRRGGGEGSRDHAAGEASGNVPRRRVRVPV